MFFVLSVASLDDTSNVEERIHIAEEETIQVSLNEAVSKLSSNS